MKYGNILILFGILGLKYISGSLTKDCIPKIAVIGGGIGGASASHFISQLFGNNENLKIHLFEPRTIGGRMATVNIRGNEYESGGSIIHSRNRLMRHFVNILGLKERVVADQRFAIWNGKEFVFEESSYKIVTLARLIYRYGLQPFKLNWYIESILHDFDNIYEHHENGKAFSNLTALLAAMNNKFPKMLNLTTEDHFKKLGYSPELIDELIQATLVVNYGQEKDVQSFVGCVSIAGAGFSLWSIEGGNKKVPEKLIETNKNIEVKRAFVEKIRLEAIDNGTVQYKLHYRNIDKNDYVDDIYDIVIVATPLTNDHDMPIKFENFGNSGNFKFPGEYQTTYATFIKGNLKPSYFGDEDVVEIILSCDPEKTNISSIGKLSSIEGVSSDVWKIFTRKPLDNGLVHKMFSQVDNIEAIRWKAYPKYSTSERFDTFRLHDGLYHVNAVEWAASAMEMSAIGGRNVAILAHNWYTAECQKHDTDNLEQTEKLPLEKYEL